MEVSLVDSSVDALKLASANVRDLGVEVHAAAADAMELLGEMDGESFDVVICDPPAFVKKKADSESGLRAYTKLNRDAIRLVKPGGVFVASSCSGLVKTDDWTRVLVDASAKAGRTFKQVLCGGHGPDHPVRPEFPEGQYLKCLIGRIEYPY
ncbi:MAG: methyltransferase domain-containing protein [Calothrix sp. SM1_5_4]|nr:methyltransferase domain-containing protein [Calothrix sp. SM1_5_4]